MVLTSEKTCLELHARNALLLPSPIVFQPISRLASGCFDTWRGGGGPPSIFFTYYKASRDALQASFQRVRSVASVRCSMPTGNSSGIRRNRRTTPDSQAISLNTFQVLFSFSCVVGTHFLRWEENGLSDWRLPCAAHEKWDSMQLWIGTKTKHTGATEIHRNSSFTVSLINI